MKPSGKLELTWTNKHLRLLSDECGGYTWVPPSDYRVAEVRLLHDVQEVGETRGTRSRAKDNLLIRGDALNALTSHITDLDPFEKLGRRLATEPDDDLRRMELGARIVTGADGLRRTELVTTTGDRVTSAARPIPLEEARERLLDVLIGADIVPAREEKEANAATAVVEAFLHGLGSDSERVLSAFLDRAAAGLVRAVTAEHRRYAAKPSYEQVVELCDFAPARTARTESSQDRTGKFTSKTGYEGWKRSLYVQVWFDSSTERSLAMILDDANEIEFWVRLHRGDLPILWQSDGREYNPDFIAVEKSGTHWLIESKADKDLASEEVKGKESAAQRWSSHVSSDPKVGAKWRYLLVSEDAIATAKGSWEALKKLGAA